MPDPSQYLFTSARLGFRNWKEEHLLPMAQINADPAVMEFFPALRSEEDTRQFIQRMQYQLQQEGFCYYAVERLDTGACIGFTGLSIQDFEAAFTPCVDIGWRLAPEAWNMGFATEAARRCIRHGFTDLGLERIVAIAPSVNTRSVTVMRKAGMQPERTFSHPLLQDYPRLKECVLYSIRKEAYSDSIYT